MIEASCHSDLSCSYLSVYQGIPYSHGLALWRMSAGEILFSCYCESGYWPGSSPLAGGYASPAGPGVPKACEPCPSALLALIEQETDYVHCALSLLASERIDLSDGTAAIEASVKRLHKHRGALQQWLACHQQEQEEQEEQATVAGASPPRHAPCNKPPKKKRKKKKRAAKKQKGPKKKSGKKKRRRRTA